MNSRQMERISLVQTMFPDDIPRPMRRARIFIFSSGFSGRI
ncbi:MAG: hypothetical protein WCH07_04070 [Deltaproteobacteria bacterium]